ncbi:uncharacterized protein LOC130810320 [Amaranthus tricolor]|uniref:uncharacterized protein LOC130810320 n=1 Tax=Amaranthus tricolor TaxID=29722 RepID=UPI00258507A7|nr:uncharacterized protein LOC130810320 [Amaranthus tricolor]
MANKKKSIPAKRVRGDATTDESDSDDGDRGGCTVLAKVGKAIHEGQKIQLEWTKKPEIPCGEHKTTFYSYIGIIARERVNINYKDWYDLPEQLLDEVYEFIAKGFVVLEHRKNWILSRAGTRWRAWKARLRKNWLYRSIGIIREKPPKDYPWILQIDWDKFIKYCTSKEFKELSETNRKRQIRRHLAIEEGDLGINILRKSLKKS